MVLAQPTRTAVYGPVRTVVWQGSAGDRRPYANLTGNSEISGLETGTGDSACQAEISRSGTSDLRNLLSVRGRLLLLACSCGFFRIWILLRDQQDFPGGTLFRCCVRLVRVLQCETLAKWDRQLP
jgi:hypothetical protein